MTPQHMHAMNSYGSQNKIAVFFFLGKKSGLQDYIYSVVVDLGRNSILEVILFSEVAVKLQISLPYISLVH